MSDLIPSSSDVLYDDAPSPASPSLDRGVRQRRKWRTLLPIIVVLVLIVGVVAAVLASKTNLDLRQFAWGGLKTNQQALQNQQQLNIDQIAELQGKKSEAAALFTSLSKTYYKADVVNISVPDFQVTGVAFQQYDPDIDRTLVFARLENLPLIQAVPTMWLESNAGQFMYAGIGDVVIENNIPVGYFVTSLEGDASGFKTLHFAYDAKASQTKPGSVYLSVNFREDQP